MKIFLDVISYIIDAIPLYIFMEHFLGKRRRKVTVWQMVSVYILIELFPFILEMVFHYDYGLIELNLLLTTLMTIVVTFLYESTIGKRILSVGIYQILAIASEFLSNFIIQWSNQEVDNNSVMIGLYMAKIVMFILVLLIRLIGKSDGNIEKRYIVFYIVVPVLSMVVMRGLYFSGTEGMSVVFSAISVIVINFIMYYLLMVFANYSMEKNRQEQMEQQVKMQQEKYEQLTEAFTMGNRILHDTNKHLRNIHSYLDREKIEDAKNYIEEIDATLARTFSGISTGNMVMDSVLGNAKMRLENENRRCEITINMDSSKLCVRDYDLVVVLGNIIDNAVESVLHVEEEEYARMEVKIRLVEQVLLIYVRNGIGKKRGHTGKDRWFHGLGMQNVERVLERYGGGMQITEEGKWYETIARMPMDTDEP